MSLEKIREGNDEEPKERNAFYSSVKFCGRVYSSFDDFKTNGKLGTAFIVMGIMTAFFTFLCVVHVFGSNYITSTSILGVASIVLFFLGWSSIKCCGSCNKK